MYLDDKHTVVLCHNRNKYVCLVENDPTVFVVTKKAIIGYDGHVLIAGDVTMNKRTCVITCVGNSYRTGFFFQK